MIACCTSFAADSLVFINFREQKHHILNLPIVAVADNGLVRLSGTSFLVLGKTPTDLLTLYIVDASDSQDPKYAVLPRLGDNHEKPIQKDWISSPMQLSIPRTHGAARGLTHAIFYKPRNPYYTGPPDSLPPLILSFHGGPASHSSPALDPKVQFWTSRGFAVAEINYAGSSGYGRDYRTMLDGNWGEYEADDAASCASYLTQKGLIDGSRVGLTGKSSGGYAVLQALTRHPDLWAAGVSIAGVSDLTELMRTMHKFENPYVVRLILGAAQCSNTELESIGEARSPFAKAASLKLPLLLMHGVKDKVVSKRQSEKMRDAVVSASGCVRLVLFDEGHSFRMPENIVAAKQEEEKWWIKYLVTNEMQ
jgi:dipeptidyl aminopeptidase/acylaminoacyl peptidase